MQFEEIYRSYFTDVYRYLLGQTGGNKLLAEDLTSETFFKAMQKIDSYQGEAKLSVWLIQIAKNAWIDYLRKQKPRQELSEEQFTQISDQQNIANRLTDQETAGQIQQLVHQLADPYKEVFLLRFYGELSFKDIAKLFDKDANWACVTYYRARQKVRQEMEEGKS